MALRHTTGSGPGLGTGPVGLALPRGKRRGHGTQKTPKTQITPTLRSLPNAPCPGVSRNPPQFVHNLPQFPPSSAGPPDPGPSPAVVWRRAKRGVHFRKLKPRTELDQGVRITPSCQPPKTPIAGHGAFCRTHRAPAFREIPLYLCVICSSFPHALVGLRIRALMA